MNNIKIVLLAAINSIHTRRWANGLAGSGHEIHLVTQHRGGDDLSGNVHVHYLPVKGRSGYLLNSFFLKKILAQIKPDLLHAHYASGYGTLGRLSKFSPFILSVWGSDVYEFPEHSLFKRKILQNNLKSADLVLSTSKELRKRINKICSNLSDITITPFGIDTKLFCPTVKTGCDDLFVIGTVKTLSYKYGIDILIRGFSEVKEVIEKKDASLASRLRLLIVGEGRDKKKLEQLASSLNISGFVEFAGHVPHSSVPQFLNRMDIFVAPSRLESESFGVAVLEASSSGLPVIVADVGGLPEVVVNNKTGLVVPREDPNEIAGALNKLIFDKDLRIIFGSSGRERVKIFYKWGNSVEIMSKIYKEILEN